MARPKWKQRLRAELDNREEFDAQTDEALSLLLRKKSVLSSNYDTTVSLDFPHYCSFATEGCGGAKGWCYTFQGALARPAHHKKVAFNDVLARRLPVEMANKIQEEVNAAVAKKELPHPNLRINGSGEAAPHHIKLLTEIVERGVAVWGFSRNLDLISELQDRGVKLLFSCDKTTRAAHMRRARELGLKFAYTSVSVTDSPPREALVVFPLHRSGRVREVIDTENLCPKVVDEYLHNQRQPSYCQQLCNRCHQMDT